METTPAAVILISDSDIALKDKQYIDHNLDEYKPLNQAADSLVDMNTQGEVESSEGNKGGIKAKLVEPLVKYFPISIAQCFYSSSRYGVPQPSQQTIADRVLHEANAILEETTGVTFVIFIRDQRLQEGATSKAIQEATEIVAQNLLKQNAEIPGWCANFAASPKWEAKVAM